MTDMRHSLYFSIFFSVWLVGLLLPATFVYYCDPYQVFHKSKFPGLGLGSNQRYQNAGLINSYLADPNQHYDSILIGTSLSANFTTQPIQQLLHWQKPLRLLMEGGSPQEQAMVLLHASQQPAVKHILWELFPNLYIRNENNYVVNKAVFPDYLYNNNPWDDHPYVFNQDILKQSWYAWSGYATQFQGDINTLGYWGNNPAIAEQHKHFNSPENLRIVHDAIPLHLENITEANPFPGYPYPVIQDIVFPVIDTFCNRDVELVLFIPPVSKMDYLLHGVNYADRAIYMPRYILQKTAECKNIRLYAFDLMNFSNDFNNYKDREHYLPPINLKIIEFIAAGEGLLTYENIEAYEAGFRKILNEKRVYSSYQE